MKAFLPLTEMNADVVKKVVAAVRHLEQHIAEPGTAFLWNELFFQDSYGIYFTTLHDGEALNPDWQHQAGFFRISLYTYGQDIVVTSDIHNDCHYDIWFITNRGTHLQKGAEKLSKRMTVVSRRTERSVHKVHTHVVS